MPSWNIHTAHVEHLLAAHRAEELGIGDANAFLFGNYVPDVFVGFMVPDASTRIDYCLTHHTSVSRIPVPDADWYWDRYIAARLPPSPAGSSLALGVWAHLVADGIYNGRFLTFCQNHNVPEGDELRVSKQADFDLFGRSLGATAHVEATPELLVAAERFSGYRITPDDVDKTIAVADGIVRANGELQAQAHAGRYQLLDADWLADAFAECDTYTATWLTAWQRERKAGENPAAADLHAQTGLAPIAPIAPPIAPNAAGATIAPPIAPNATDALVVARMPTPTEAPITPSTPVAPIAPAAPPASIANPCPDALAASPASAVPSPPGAFSAPAAGLAP